VRFEEPVHTIYFLPEDEDRRGQWMQLALDAHRFKLRIKTISPILEHMLCSKLDKIKVT